MTIVRELVARLGFQVDESGFKRAAEGVDRIREGIRGADSGLRNAGSRFLQTGQAATQGAKGVQAFTASGRDLMAGLARAAGAAGLGMFVKSSIELASNARETENVIGEVFGQGGAQRIAEWSARVGAEVGRSKFTLRDFAAQVGAIAAPMTGNAALAETMATSFSQLAVDLSSFFNATEGDALAALKSGLSGEAEPLKRFGVVLSDATLQEFALAQGVRKRVQQMTVAEKTELRFRFIMAKTAAAQGDAARTAGGYANSMRALKDGVKDLQTDMGLALLPTVERIVRVFRQGIDRFRELAKNTRILEHALMVLGGIALVVAAQFLAPFILPAVAVAALILLIDDLHALFTGGTSVIGHYLDVLFGIGTADALVQNLTVGVQILSETWDTVTASISETLALLPDLQGMWDLMTGGVTDFGTQVQIVFAMVLDAMSGLVNDAIDTFTPFAAELSKMPGVNIDLPKFLDTGRAGRMSGELEARQKERNDRIREASARRAEGEALRRSQSSFTTASGEVVGFGRARLSAAPGSVSAPVAAGAGGASVSIGPTTIVQNGIRDPMAAARAAKEAMAAERRKTVAAMQKAGSS